MFNSRIEEITNYLRCNKVVLPIYRMIAPILLEGAMYSVEHPTSIDLSSYADEIFYYITALQKENSDLKKTLRDMAEDNYGIHYHRQGKRDILEKHFPDLLKKLPYYAGGDL